VSSVLNIISTIYGNAKRLEILPVPIECDVLRSYAVGLHKLEKAIKEGASGISVHHIRTLQTLYWSLLSNLLPYDKLYCYYIKGQDLIFEDLDNESISNPSLSAVCSGVKSSLRSFSVMTNNPLLDVLGLEISTSPTVGEKCIVVSDHQHFEETQRLISGTPPLEGSTVCLPRALREFRDYSEIYLVGPPRRFDRDRYVLTSPRAPRISSVRFSWLRDFEEYEDIFVQRQGTTKTSGYAQNRAVLSFVIDGAAEVPEIDWKEAGKLAEIEIRAEFEGEHDDLVLARLYALADNRFTYLSAEIEATVLSLDPEMLSREDAEWAISRADVSSVSAGDYIVLRTKGGNDAVVEKANAILGADSQPCREKLRAWKNELRDRIESLGEASVLAELVLEGAENPSKANVRNWASRETIKPRSLRDFGAIMRILSRTTEIVDQWDNAERVLSAHRQAGHLIRQALLDAIAGADLSTLRELGSQVFTIEGCGSMTAYRVEQVDNRLKKIPGSCINRVVHFATA
jgi:hypothetical protein